MENRTLVYGAAISAQALLAVGQITLKIFAQRLAEAGWAVFRDGPTALHVGTPALGVGVIYGVVITLWIFVLQNMPVNRAFLFVSLTFIFVPIFSHFLLGEEIGAGVIIGAFFIIAGISAGVLLR